MDYKLNCESMKSVGFTDDEQSAVWKIVSAILHLVSTYLLEFVWDTALFPYR